MPRWWASSWITVSRTSSARSRGSGKSSSSGSRKSVILFGNGHVVGAPFRARRAFVEAVEHLVGVEAALASSLGRRLVGDHDRDLVERAGERHAGCRASARSTSASKRDVARPRRAAADGRGGRSAAGTRDGASA